MSYRMSSDPEQHAWFWEGLDKKHVTEAVAGLIESNRDASHGLRMMAEILEDLPIAPKLIAKAEIRDGFASKLAVLMARYGAGDEIPEGGTFRGKRFLWRMQIATALRSDDRAAVLDIASKGNADMQEDYSKALDEGLPDDVRKVVLQQSREIRQTGEWLESEKR